VIFNDWADARPMDERMVICEDAAGYVPGESRAFQQALWGIFINRP
jgi:hypothetical protein